MLLKNISGFKKNPNSGFKGEKAPQIPIESDKK